jgi:hypothetical protein
MVLDEVQLSDLLDYLDDRLAEAGCDDSRASYCSAARDMSSPAI